ncbi:hypothetical protein [Ligaoa zhengdingensis]|jgi:hypothetical protein|uniref:hypothetical protein n=1 Tax=Ligaoa zhengdingensis TaxID=2763658 RepID=UPI00206258D6|nr:MAG TPA: hypothetical protein [Caudoviricetes sp.]
MARLYTVDGKLLVDTPEVRIGDQVFPVDDRQKTAKKIAKLMEQDDGTGIDAMDEILKLALGPDAFKKIDEMNLPFRAHQKVLELVSAAVMGEDPEAAEARFQGAKAEG